MSAAEWTNNRKRLRAHNGRRVRPPTIQVSVKVKETPSSARERSPEKDHAQTQIQESDGEIMGQCGDVLQEENSAMGQQLEEGGGTEQDLQNEPETIPEHIRLATFLTSAELDFEAGNAVDEDEEQAEEIARLQEDVEVIKPYPMMVQYGKRKAGGVRLMAGGAKLIVAGAVQDRAGGSELEGKEDEPEVIDLEDEGEGLQTMDEMLEKDAGEGGEEEVEEVVPTVFPDSRGETFTFPPEYETVFSNTRSSAPIHHVHAAMAVLVTLFPISTDAYRAIRELLQTVTTMEDVKALHELPKSLTTLQGWLSNRLPMSRVVKKKIPIDKSKLSNSEGKDGTADMYIFDETELLRLSLNDHVLRQQMHFGFAELVDAKSEHWHGRAWMESIRSSPIGMGGQGWPRYPDDPQNFILQSDFVMYQPPGFCTPVFARIRGIFKDKRDDCDQQSRVYPKGTLCVSIEPLKETFELSHEIQTILRDRVWRGTAGSTGTSWVIQEDPLGIIPTEWILKRMPNVVIRDSHIYPKDYDPPPPPSDGDPLIPFPYPEEIWAIVNLSWPQRTRSSQHRHPLRSELELKVYGRSFLIDTLINNPLPVVSIPMSYFSDGFGAWRNSYHSLFAIYHVMANLPLHLRRKLHNNKLVTLGPFGAKFQDVIAALAPASLRLDAGLPITLSIGSAVPGAPAAADVQTVVCAYHHVHTSDLPQQNDSSGTLRQNAAVGCRSCLIPASARSDLEYDIWLNGRYELLMDAVRLKAETATSKKQTKDTLIEFGLADRPGPWNLISPALPQFGTSFPIDVCHSELSGMTSRVLEVITSWFLTEKLGCAAYIAAFRRISLPQGWSRLQNPVTHQMSYSFADKGRLSLLLPYIFRDFMRGSKFIRSDALTKLRREFSDTDPHSHFQRLLVLLARSNAMVLQSPLSDTQATELVHRTLEFRAFFQRFVKLTGTAKDEDAGEKQLRRPNVHQAVHLAGNLLDYATMRNVEVSIGETKHKQLKEKAQRSNKSHVDKQLILDTSRKEALRAVINRIYVCRDRGEELTSGLDISISFLLDRCPVLFSRNSGASEHGARNPPVTANTKAQEFLGGGEKYSDICLSLQLPQDVTQRRGYPSKTLIDPQSLFARKLHEAYQNLGIELYSQGSKKVKFHDRLSMTPIASTGTPQTVQSSKTNATRITPGTWIRTFTEAHATEGHIARVRAICSHSRLLEHRVFILVDYAKFSHHDYSVDSQVYTCNLQAQADQLNIVSPCHVASVLHLIPIPDLTLPEGKFAEIDIYKSPSSWWLNDRLTHFL
ncbi:hypothetical protein DFH27DRAFT_611888 [Peziza echinospora]|nr:hypothetical protein DFH27DRAFT_611888 [Peziza echinospora]